MDSSNISSNKDLYTKKNRVAEASNDGSKILRNHEPELIEMRHSKDLSSNRSD